MPTYRPRNTIKYLREKYAALIDGGDSVRHNQANIKAIEDYVLACGKQNNCKDCKWIETCQRYYDKL